MDAFAVMVPRVAGITKLAPVPEQAFAAVPLRIWLSTLYIATSVVAANIEYICAFTESSVHHASQYKLLAVRVAEVFSVQV